MIPVCVLGLLYQQSFIWVVVRKLSSSCSFASLSTLTIPWVRLTIPTSLSGYFITRSSDGFFRAPTEMADCRGLPFTLPFGTLLPLVSQ